MFTQLLPILFLHRVPQRVPRVLSRWSTHLFLPACQSWQLPQAAPIMPARFALAANTFPPTAPTPLTPPSPPTPELSGSKRQVCARFLSCGLGGLFVCWFCLGSCMQPRAQDGSSQMQSPCSRSTGRLLCQVTLHTPRTTSARPQTSFAEEETEAQEGKEAGSPGS